VRVWDAQNGAKLAVLRGHEFWVKSVCYSPDGRRIVSGSWDGSMRVWDAHSGECLEVIQGSGDVRAIAAGLGNWGGAGDTLTPDPSPAIEGQERAVFRAIARRLETVIEPAAGGQAAAWLPETLEHITTHLSGRAWAGSASNHLHLIRVEGLARRCSTVAHHFHALPSMYQFADRTS
jgi:hypothetical protein